MSGKLLITLTVSLVLAGCDHCTKGGRWHDGYVQADPRCTYFCADPEEKYCAKSPAAAEQLQGQDLPNIQKRAAQQLDADIVESKKVCTKLGFKSDTDAMANCLLSQQQMMTFQRTEANQRNQQAARAAEADAMQRANAFSGGFRNGIQTYKSQGANQMSCSSQTIGGSTFTNCQ